MIRNVEYGDRKKHQRTYLDGLKRYKNKGVGAAGVEGGKLYKLNVTIGYASEEIRFVIDDWILNTLEVGDIYGEPVM